MNTVFGDPLHQAIVEGLSEYRDKAVRKLLHGDAKDYTQYRELVAQAGAYSHSIEVVNEIIRRYVEEPEDSGD